MGAGIIFNNKIEKGNIIAPYSLRWAVTEACNSRCKYCDYDKPEFVGLDYTETLNRIINLAPKHIFLMGGEPTLVKQLPEITKRLKRNFNPHIGVNTNFNIFKRVNKVE